MADDLDSILENALNEFEHGSGAGGASAASAAEPEGPDANPEGDRVADDLSREMSNFFSGLAGNTEFRNSFEEAVRRLGEDPSGNVPDLASMFQALGAGAPRGDGAPEGTTEEGQDFDRNMSAALSLLQDSARQFEAMPEARQQELNEAVMERLAEHFARLGDDPQFSSVMENMMKHMLSRDVLYPPLSQIRDKYPTYLEEHPASMIGEEEFNKFQKQYDYVKQICAVYEAGAEDYPKLVQLMQEMQDCGPPPPELLKDVAPQVQFGPDGSPVLPNIAPGGECNVM
eukprot:tig00000525_g1951.t1